MAAGIHHCAVFRSEGAWICHALLQQPTPVEHMLGHTTRPPCDACWFELVYGAAHNVHKARDEQITIVERSTGACNGRHAGVGVSG